MKIYVASSWRNAMQPYVVDALRGDGHEVYDFRHPDPGDDGFQWSEVDPNWKEWPRHPDAYLAGLEHPAAKRGFAKDMAGLNGADVTVLVLPCGRSAHLEAGYAAGQGKPVIILLDPTFEPELMYKLAYRCVITVDQVRTAILEIAAAKAGDTAPRKRDEPNWDCADPTNKNCSCPACVLTEQVEDYQEATGTRLETFGHCSACDYHIVPGRPCLRCGHLEKPAR